MSYDTVRFFFPVCLCTASLMMAGLFFFSARADVPAFFLRPARQSPFYIFFVDCVGAADEAYYEKHFDS